MNLHQRPYWIFDMDGTLTLAVHDFEAIRVELGLPPGRPILEALADLSPAQADPLHRRLGEIEFQLACQATPQAGAKELLAELHRQGRQVGILTRNTRRNAYETLRACGLQAFFEPACVLGRESAPPKPNPDGIQQLLALWQASPPEAVMVGDYMFDLEAGRRAGTATVYLDVTGQGLRPDQADLTVESLEELIPFTTAS